MNIGESQKYELIKRIEAAIESVRPYLISDGGDVELVEVTDNLIVKVKLLGACEDCPFSLQTLKSGIEQTIKNEVPEIQGLIAVNDKLF